MEPIFTIFPEKEVNCDMYLNKLALHPQYKYSIQMQREDLNHRRIISQEEPYQTGESFIISNIDMPVSKKIFKFCIL